ncbi:MAG TPA: UDP-glucose/GDP-mannose dehydrogenase family protein [Paracoccaceae bacterium]|nr:UDP-glucose/GDP-mannose dehydrogenase family protein [Paracoccaceae bacterium]
MRITMIGTGYVGLVTGVCLSDFGHDVVCVDRDREKIAGLKDGKVPIYEPGLERLLAKNMDAGRLGFTTVLAEAVEGASAAFIAVGTPARRGDGHADLSYVFGAAEELAPLIGDYMVVVAKSTVPVGTNRAIRELIQAARPNADFDVASNPEFLREGAAIEDFMRPDRVVVGTENGRARGVMSEIYRPLNLRETPIVFTSLESAEMIKYAANAFLATKITFVNEIADLCEKVGADVQHVAKGIGLDGRIGPKFLHPGPGYGGSCFPKDTRALVRTAEEHESPLKIVGTVVEVNEARRRRMAAKIVAAAGGSVAGKRIAILGVTFKPGTDDMREAPALDVVPALREAGAEIVICDPKGRKEGEAMLGPATWVDRPYDAAKGADVLVLMTEWNEFRALDLGRLFERMAGDVMVDLRNVYVPEDARAAGFRYVSVGRQ